MPVLRKMFAQSGKDMQISHVASEILMAMGHGMKLTVERTAPHGIRLVFDPTREGLEKSFREIDVSNVVFEELWRKGLITKVTELGEPPTAVERKKQGGGRLGWKELGWDGEKYDWWVCTQ